MFCRMLEETVPNDQVVGCSEGQETQSVVIDHPVAELAHRCLPTRPVCSDMGVEVSSQDCHLGRRDQVQRMLKLGVEIVLGQVWAGLGWCVGRNDVGLDRSIDGEDRQAIRNWLEGDYAAGCSECPP